VSGVSGGKFTTVADPATEITSFTQAQVTGGQIQFIDDGNETGPAYDVTVSDGLLDDGPDAATINFTNINDATLATNINYGDPFTEDTGYSLRQIIVTDPDNPESITATLTLDSELYGSLTTSSGGSFNPATGEWRLTDTVGNINTALATLTYIPATNFSQDTFIDVRIVDGLEDGTLPQIGRIDLTVTPVGDTPTVDSIATDAGVLTGSIFVLPNPSDGPEVTHFRIINITNGSLFQQNGVTPINNNDFITLAEGNGGVKFLPASGADGSFGVQSSENGSTVAAQSLVATSVISINAPPAPEPEEIIPVPDEPAVPGEPAGEDDPGEEILSPDITPVDVTLVVAAGQLEPEIDLSEPEIDLTEPGSSPAEPGSETQEEPAPSADQSPAGPQLVAEFSKETSSSESSAGSLPQKMNQVAANLAFRTFAITGSFLSESDEFNVNNSSLADGDTVLSPLQNAANSLLNLLFRQRLTQEYDYINNSLDAFREETEQEGLFGRTVVGSAIATSTGLSAGYVIWLLRSGALVSSLLSSLPAWQFTDPLAILAGRRREDEDQDEDDSLESIVAGNQKNVDGKEKEKDKQKSVD